MPKNKNIAPAESTTLGDILRDDAAEQRRNVPGPEPIGAEPRVPEAVDFRPYDREPGAFDDLQTGPESVDSPQGHLGEEMLKSMGQEAPQHPEAQ